MSKITENAFDAAETVHDDDLDIVSGGLNPQPLPPRYAFATNNFAVNPVNNSLAMRGIIIVGG